MTPETGKDKQGDKLFFLAFYEKARRRLDEIAARTDVWEKSDNPFVREAAERFFRLNSSGKRFRGMLVYIGYLLAREGSADLDYSEADALAGAYELFQTAILIHDDVIDNADSRRGQSTVHRQYYRDFAEAWAHRTGKPADSGIPEEARKEWSATGKSAAVCVGDIGFYMAEQTLVKAYAQKPYFGKILTYFHKMITQTLYGELLDTLVPCLERYSLWDEAMTGDWEPEDFIMDIYHLKTSTYTVIGPVCAGMLLGGASEEKLAQMEKAADKIGLAFQIQDDRKGILGTEAAIGKDVGSDISEFKQTVFYAYLRRQGGASYRELMKYYGKPALSAQDIQAVRDLFEKSGAIAYADRMVCQLYDSAQEELKGFTWLTADAARLLNGFIAYLREKS